MTAERPAEGPVGRRRVRWGPVTGAITFLYLVVFAVQVTAAGFDPRSFNRMHRIQGNAFVRVLLAGVLLAVLFHAFDGLRITLCAMRPTLARHEPKLRFAVQFLTFALGVPAAFLVCWPSTSELFR